MADSDRNLSSISIFGGQSSASAVAEHYDAIVAQRYENESQGSRVLQSSRDMALDQIRRYADTHVHSVLDLGTGTGSFLQAASEIFPDAKLAGVDASQGMLAVAREKFPDDAVDWIQEDIENAGRLVPREYFDLVALHFVLAYVDDERAIRVAKSALKPGGMLSLITSTCDSFETSREYVKRYYPRFQNPVPDSHEHVRRLVESAGFSVVADRVAVAGFHFESFDELYAFGHEGGWFTTRDMTSLPRWARFMLKVISLHEFPLDEELRVSILLCRA